MSDSRKIASRYWIGDIVYQRVRADEAKGMITGIFIDSGGLMYLVTWATHDSRHYEIELTDTYIPDWASDDDGSEESEIPSP